MDHIGVNYKIPTNGSQKNIDIIYNSYNIMTHQIHNITYISTKVTSKQETTSKVEFR